MGTMSIVIMERLRRFIVSHDLNAFPSLHRTAKARTGSDKHCRASARIILDGNDVLTRGGNAKGAQRFEEMKVM